MMRYNFGNIRELENTIERAMLLTEGRSIGSVDRGSAKCPARPAAVTRRPSKIPPTGIALRTSSGTPSSRR